MEKATETDGEKDRERDTDIEGQRRRQRKLRAAIVRLADKLTLQDKLF
jgi:hypothetical protein